MVVNRIRSYFSFLTAGLEGLFGFLDAGDGEPVFVLSTAGGHVLVDGGAQATQLVLVMVGGGGHAILLRWQWGGGGFHFTSVMLGRGKPMVSSGWWGQGGFPFACSTLERGVHLVFLFRHGGGGERVEFCFGDDGEAFPMFAHGGAPSLFRRWQGRPCRHFIWFCFWQ